MATRLTMLARIAAVLPLVGGVAAIAGAVQLYIEWQDGPGFGFGPIFAAGLVVGAVGLGFFPALALWRGASAIRDAGPELHASSGRSQALATVVAALIVVGWVIGGVLVLAAGRADVAILAGYLGLGLIAATAALTARYVPEAKPARTLLYVAVIFAILGGLLAWAFSRG